MNRILEIRDELINRDTDLSNVLRKAMVLSTEIELPELGFWVRRELNRYVDGDKIPVYRSMKPSNFGTFAGPWNSWAKNVPIPTYNLPQLAKEFAENMELYDSVAELQGMTEGTYRRQWPPEIVLLAQDALKMADGKVLVEASQPIPGYMIRGVLDSIRNRLLEFILELDAGNITPETVADGTAEPQQARQIFNLNIYGDSNVVAAGENVTQRSRTVQKNDIESLATLLRTLDVDQDDIYEIASALQQDPIGSDGSFGPKVNSWLGKMINKAASGTINVSAEAAATALTGALNGYYGL